MPWGLCSNSWNTRFCSERMHNQTIPDEILTPMNESKVSSAEEYYNIYMLGINHSKGLTDLGYIKIDLLLCLISIFIVMYLCIYRGVKGTGKNKRKIPLKLVL
jgi:solute carrier family 6 GABA transporter-like protein 6/8/11/12/13